MPQDVLDWNRQKASWGLLKSLAAQDIDLARADLLRAAPLEELRDETRLESLLAKLGLNDEAMGELPSGLHAHCGRGLRLWQFPNQLSKYLVHVSRLGVRSYLEIGIRHGGSFVTTTEYLERFCPLDFAVGVDVIPCPAMPRYQLLNPKARFWCTSSRSEDFARRLDELGPIDLVFVDSHHEENQCRAEFEVLVERAALIAFHDISNVGCPGVGRVWREVSAMPGFDCHEFVEQYPGLGPFMGIGLAIKKDRPTPPETR
jgi:cephalosporin hydroxylase